MRHEAIDKAAVVPVSDERLGERVCLVFKAHNGSEISIAEMLSHLETVGLSRFDMPEVISQIEAMPLTASGKVLKRAIQEQIALGLIVPIAVEQTGKKLSLVVS